MSTTLKKGTGTASASKIHPPKSKATPSPDKVKPTPKKKIDSTSSTGSLTPVQTKTPHSPHTGKKSAKALPKAQTSSPTPPQTQSTPQPVPLPASPPSPPKPSLADHTFSFSTKPLLTDFTDIKLIGSGTFGTIKFVKHEPTQKLFALKCLNKVKLCFMQQAVHVRYERDLMYACRHPRIVHLYATMQDADNIYLLMEFAPGGEIYSHLRRMEVFDVATTKYYAAQLLTALEFMHSKGIAYRDLKPENLLLDSRGQLKLTDLGFAKEIDEPAFTLCGTPEYLAPELIRGAGHDFGVDWWAFGILIYEMLYGHPPFEADRPEEVYQLILKYRPPFPDDEVEIPLEAKDLIMKLLKKDKTNRLGCLAGRAEDVKNHPFFEGIDWATIQDGSLQAPIQPLISNVTDTSNFDEDAVEADDPSEYALPEQDPSTPLPPEADPDNFADF
ncbi:putative cAMP-dependent protein kinase catalytic subunit [Blattamonas nauphoetae]|uniref:cAMP-dependent protein kinase catalytic subunit n=1 Tax=Blattamonas nauphoetae TaxID=2049346 RepID=A0ABQ9X051_9EUKA|nr:putative cAMP-dependent protein kinase catalytic subunit [Blattamonas nauphoetae]